MVIEVSSLGNAFKNKKKEKESSGKFREGKSREGKGRGGEVKFRQGKAKKGKERKEINVQNKCSTCTVATSSLYFYGGTF